MTLLPGPVVGLINKFAIFYSGFGYLSLTTCSIAAISSFVGQVMLELSNNYLDILLLYNKQENLHGNN
jgi:hypothetical protein